MDVLHHLGAVVLVFFNILQRLNKFCGQKKFEYIVYQKG
jgi:hypothetical protein